MARAILGISAFYHDSAAALLVDGQLVAAAQEERFTRKKQDASFPTRAIDFCLQEGGLKASDLDLIAFYDKPFLKFERLLETYHSFAPRGLKSFLAAAPVWVKEKMFMRKMLRDELEQLDPRIDWRQTRMLFPEHHLSHAASAFYPSPFEDAAILTVDGVGEWATTTVGKGRNKEIEIFREMPFPHSLGLLYSAFTYYCGFKVNSGEYKLMGLAPYGSRDSERVRSFETLIRDELVDIKEDGSILLNMDYFDYAVGLRMCQDARWQRLFGLPPRQQESEISQPYMDMALAIQNITEEIVLKLAQTAVDLSESRNLVMAGGVALNCVANGKLLNSGIVDKLWIQPAAGDAGGALGAAFAAYHLWLDEDRVVDEGRSDAMQGAYLGPEFSDIDIRRMCRTYQAPSQEYSDFPRLCEDITELLEQGMVVGWFQGRMEFGPRALGNRSILGDPRDPEMQKKLNLKIKFREGFRPFAPSVLAEDCSRYFSLSADSPYMLLVAGVQQERCRSLPENYAEMDLHDRLYFLRSDIPAVTHVDYSARVQTVHRETNPRYWQLINAFKQKTGYGLLVNTSFNVRSEPIVCTPEDAYKCFMRTEMDYLVIGDHLFSKAAQPRWHEGICWQDQYELD